MRPLSALFALSALAAVGCGGLWGEPYTEHFASHRQASRNSYDPTMLPVRVGADGTESADWLITNPEKLDWGYQYQVQIANSTMAADHRRRITKIDAKEATPGKTFTLDHLRKMNVAPDGRHFTDGKAFTCSPPVCAALDAYVADDVYFDADARIPMDVDGPVEVLAVRLTP